LAGRSGGEEGRLSCPLPPGGGYITRLCARLDGVCMQHLNGLALVSAAARIQSKARLVPAVLAQEVLYRSQTHDSELS